VYGRVRKLLDMIQRRSRRLATQIFQAERLTFLNLPAAPEEL
jgi:hypothetical protein